MLIKLKQSILHGDKRLSAGTYLTVDEGFGKQLISYGAAEAATIDSTEVIYPQITVESAIKPPRFQAEPSFKSVFIAKTTPSSQPVKHISTGSRKNNARINETRYACERIREAIEQEKKVFENDKNNWKPSLLLDNGKTTWPKFIAAVQESFGEIKYHHITALEEWKKVPKAIKLKGRPQG